ncbi:MAG: alanine dehydrogenase [Chromatiales bacterium]|jgi:alanine dehydrogenase
MRIGIPREIKVREGRVGLVPCACGDLVRAGHRVALESGAGDASGFPDERYTELGVEILPDAEALYGESELVVKVKEPVDPEIGLLRPDHLLFCFLHLAANPDLMRRLLEIGLTAVAFETVQEGGGLPILAPMSDIAGRIGVQVGATLLHRHAGGRGLLLGGVPAAERGRVVVLGAGHAGGNAARAAAALGAEVVVFDKSPPKLQEMHRAGLNVTALYPYDERIDMEIRQADLLVGAVLVPGAEAPHLVRADQVAGMRPGSVIADISVDQGGCIETTRPTTYENPTYRVSDVVHFAVTNMPGAVPRTASVALSASLFPYVLAMAGEDWRVHPALRAGLNVQAGELIHPALRGLLSN